MILKTKNLSKSYGSQQVLSKVNMHVAKNSVYGLVGPNGAGKTTILSILAGLRHQSAGEVRLNLKREEVAVCADMPEFEPWLTARETVKLASSLSGSECSDSRAEHFLTETGLIHAIDRRVGGFSRGMTQRLALACTLVGEPKLIILDEPSSALDPKGRVEVLNIISKMSNSATVIFSSHILADVQRVCDTIGILKEGKLLYEGNMQSFLDSKVVPRWQLTVRNQKENFTQTLKKTKWITSVEQIAEGKYRIETATATDMEDNIVNILAKTNASLVSFEPIEDDLEHAFLRLTSGDET